MNGLTDENKVKNASARPPLRPLVYDSDTDNHVACVQRGVAWRSAALTMPSHGYRGPRRCFAKTHAS